MTRHVGHLSAGGGTAVTPIERLRQTQRSCDHGAIQHLRFPGERERMPGHIPVCYRLVHAFVLFMGCLLEVFVQKPGSCCPDVAVFAELTHGGGNLQGLGIILVEVFPHDAGLVSVNPTSKWHLNITRTRSTSGLAGRWPSTNPCK